jgi:RNA polymerase sigma-70 factor (ECF subfamily)
MAHAEKTTVNIAAPAASKSGHELEAAEPDDRAVVEACQRGQLDAYETLVNRYRQRVYGLAYGMVRNEHEAAEVAQEAFVRAWQGIRHFKKSASFYTWLYRITTNICIDRARRRERRPTTELDETIEPRTDPGVPEPPSANPLPAEELRRKELRQQIDAALAELSPDHRAVVQLRELEGLDYAAIARVVGCSMGTVMSRLHYARKHLQRLLKEEI